MGIARLPPRQPGDATIPPHAGGRPFHPRTQTARSGGPACRQSRVAGPSQPARKRGQMPAVTPQGANSFRRSFSGCKLPGDGVQTLPALSNDQGRRELVPERSHHAHSAGLLPGCFHTGRAGGLLRLGCILATRPLQDATGETRADGPLRLSRQPENATIPHAGPWRPTGAGANAGGRIVATPRTGGAVASEVNAWHSHPPEPNRLGMKS